MFPFWPEGSPCHGPGEVEQVFGSTFKCLYGLGAGERVCGALFEAAEGSAGVLKVVSTDAVREAQHDYELAQPGAATVADIAEATSNGDGYTLDCREVGRDSGGFGFGGVPTKEYCAVAGRLPQPGDRIRVFGRFGQVVRGVDVLVDGEWASVYFKTDAELHQEWAASVQEHRESREEQFESSQEEMDAAYEALPAIFRRRVDGYRERGGREWRMGFEGYEVFCLSEAVKIAAHVKPAFDLLMEVDRIPVGKDEERRSDLLAAARDFWPDAEAGEIERAVHDHPALIAAQVAVGRWTRLPHEEQAAVVGDGHSGNTFGMACQFAVLLEAYDSGRDDEAADWIVGHHGALAPLVGSKVYRDQAAEEGDDEPGERT